MGDKLTKTTRQICYIVTSVISFAIFIWLAVGVKWHLSFIDKIDNYEHHVLTTVSGLSTTTVHFLSNLGSPLMGIVLITFIALFLCHQKNFIAGTLTETTMIVGNIIAELFKIIIARKRPSYQLYSDASYSFPSGHVFDTTLLVLVVITFILPQIKNETYQVVCGLLLIIWNGFIIFSRIYLGAHYFSDTVGSVALAIGLWTLMLIVKPMFDKQDSDD